VVTGLPTVSGDSAASWFRSRASCTIAGFYDSSHGKFSQDLTEKPDDQIIIEVQTYL